MRDLVLDDLMHLAELDPSIADLEKMYDWYFSRNLEVAKILVGIAASLITAMLIAVFKDELKAHWYFISGTFVCAVAVGGYGLWRLNKLRLIQKQYVASVEILRTRKSIRIRLVG